MAGRTSAEPRRSLLNRTTAMRLAREEYVRVGDLLASLTPAQWAAETNCPPWDVRQMACHLLGMAEMAASVFEQRRQMRQAGARGGTFIDELCALQVEKHADLRPSDIVAAWWNTSPKAARGRRRIPGFIRRRPMPQTQQVNGVEEVWSIGFLTETILTRDPWMHRLDIAAATGVKPTLTADHDARIVDDVVREWAGRHGKPVALRLDGPAGGSWEFGSGETVHLEFDAVDFCRQLSGRAPSEGLTSVEVPF